MCSSDLIGQDVAQLDLAAACLHDLPALTRARGLGPLVDPGAVADAGHGQVHDLARKAVPDADCSDLYINDGYAPCNR